MEEWVVAQCGAYPEGVWTSIKKNDGAYLGLARGQGRRLDLRRAEKPNPDNNYNLN